MEPAAQNSRHAEFRKLVDAHEKSGLTQKAFCEKNSIVLSHFVYYRCLFKKQPSASIETIPAFMSVKIAGKEKSQMTGDIRISLPNGFICQIPHECSADRVRQLIQVLLSC